MPPDYRVLAKAVPPPPSPPAERRVPPRACRHLLALLCALVPLAAVAEDDQRSVYRDYRAARAAGELARARALGGRLAGHPLEPYVHYDALRDRLPQLPATEVTDFLARWGDSYIGERLRGEWLRTLAARGRWDLFQRDYRERDDDELRCHALAAGFARAPTAAATLAAARAAWLRPDSAPSACDAPFARFVLSPAFDDGLVWQRLRLAFAAGNGGLARYLVRQLRGAGPRADGQAWLRAHDDPTGFLAAARGSGEHFDDALLHAVTRLAQRNVDQARAAWSRATARVTVSTAVADRAAAALAVAAAGTSHPDRLALLDQVPDDAVDERVERHRLREALVAGAWPELARWTAAPPRLADETLRFRYWHARALEHEGKPDLARPIYEALARERDYYGFLAADRIGAAYAFTHVPVMPDTAEQAAFPARPAFQRMAEFRALGMLHEARREWSFELARLDRRGIELAAHLAARWGWHERAIAALGQARAYDDLVLRFPLEHRDLAGDYARRRGLTPARVLAFIRNESAFAVDARSPVGALGLMQVMPATARETAARIGLPFPRTALLYEPRANIAIGTAYLAQMLARYGGNLAMAAAAYNAGPQRVRAWQGAQCIEAERWIDVIPFVETRGYVRRALFYVALYEWRLGTAVTRLADAMPPIPPRGSSSTSGCTS